MRGFFYNPNIHLYSEYLRREEALAGYRSVLGVEIDHADDYRPEEYFQAVASYETDSRERCRRCYELRLRAAARKGREESCDAFSTTLLFSVYQKHDLLRVTGEKIAGEEKIDFLYRDLRPGWQEGGRMYRESGLYRQNYCGCIFSEKEGIERRRRKKAEREKKRGD